MMQGRCMHSPCFGFRYGTYCSSINRGLKFTKLCGRLCGEDINILQCTENVDLLFQYAHHSELQGVKPQYVKFAVD